MAPITELRYVPLQHFQSLGRNTQQAMNSVCPFIFWLKDTQNLSFLPNEAIETIKAMLRYRI